MRGTYNEKYTVRRGVIELRPKDTYSPGIINNLDTEGGRPKTGGSQRDTLISG